MTFSLTGPRRVRPNPHVTEPRKKLFFRAPGTMPTADVRPSQTVSPSAARPADFPVSQHDFPLGFSSDNRVAGPAGDIPALPATRGPNPTQHKHLQRLCSTTAISGPSGSIDRPAPVSML